MLSILDAIALITRVLWKACKAVFRGIRGLLLALILVLNIAMVAVPAVYDAVSGEFWHAISIVSDAYAVRAETRAMRRSTLDQIESDLDAARRREGDLVEERDRLRVETGAKDRRIVDVETELSTTRERIGDLSSDLEEARTREQSALSRLRQVELDRSRLTKETDNLSSEIARQRVARRQARNEAAETIHRMQGRSMRALTRNTGANSLEMIPLLGTAALFGEIAWDIYDTCQMVADMQQLETLFELEFDPRETDLHLCGMSKEDIFSTIFNGPTGPESECISARLRTEDRDPPECEGVGLEPRGFPADLPPNPRDLPPLEENLFK